MEGKGIRAESPSQYSSKILMELSALGSGVLIVGGGLGTVGTVRAREATVGVSNRRRVVPCDGVGLRAEGRGGESSGPMRRRDPNLERAAGSFVRAARVLMEERDRLVVFGVVGRGSLKLRGRALGRGSSCS